MKKSLISICIVIVLFNTCYAQQEFNAQKYFARQDLLFDSLSDKWEEGAFLGNGLLGIMVYRENTNAIRFDLGRTDVVDHREGINPSIGRARLPIGRFTLRSELPITNIHMRLDLWNAELTGTFTTGGDTVTLQALVAATKDLIIVKAKTGKKNNDLNFEWHA